MTEQIVIFGNDHVIAFLNALPYRARCEMPLDGRTLPALRVCAERGDDIPALARRCAHGLERRSRHDMRGLLIHRLLRSAGLLDEGDEQ